MSDSPSNFTNTEEASNLAVAALETSLQVFSLKYDFDFRHGVPLSSPDARFLWTNLPSQVLDLNALEAHLADNGTLQ